MRKNVLTCFLLFVFVISLFAFPTLAATTDSAYQLMYSEHISTPTDYLTQNCYFYALGIHSNANLPIGDPGCFSGNSASCFKDNVLADLSALGYTTTEVSNPNITLDSDQFLLSYYYGWWNSPILRFDIGEKRDYHFWVRRDNYAAKTNWYHKFGVNSGIMLFNYTPVSSNAAFVCDEYYNLITDTYNPAHFYPASVHPNLGINSSGQWGLILVTAEGLTKSEIQKNAEDCYLESVSSIHD